MTPLLDKLDKKGLLKRLRGVDDSHLVNLVLTPKGEEIAGGIPEILRKVLNSQQRNFDKREFDESCRLLRKFIGG